MQKEITNKQWRDAFGYYYYYYYHKNLNIYILNAMKNEKHSL